MKRVKLGIDLMSGERPISELIEGSLRALGKHPQLEVHWVGDQAKLAAHLKHIGAASSRVSIIPSQSVIGMHENPTTACRTKKDSSLLVGLKAFKAGAFDVFFSPGNTGATLTGALMEIGRLKGVRRPAIAAPLPTCYNQQIALFLDAGANVDCDALHLIQFALMGSIYYQTIYQNPAPRVGILNVGEEENKGNQLAKKVFSALEESFPHFVGNLEPRELFNQQAEVVVCDGFVGNIFLKASEAAVKQMNGIMRQEISSSWGSRLGAFFMRHSLRKIKERMAASRFGAAPLLGVKKPVLIGHGSSDAKSIENMAEVAIRQVEQEYQSQMEAALANYPFTPPNTSEGTP